MSVRLMTEKSVHSVVVIFDESSEWNTLVKHLLTIIKAYIFVGTGEPPLLAENIIPSRQDSNISLMN